jgi:lipopolysaccharide transport system ATP-binding protein
MSEVSKGGRTVLFVSHNMAAVENLCQRGILLKQGQLIYDGDSKNAVQQYLTMATVSNEGTSGVIDLSNAPTRIAKYKETPDQKSILQKLELLTDGDQPAPRAVQIGARLAMRFHLHSTRWIPSFTMAIGINNTMSQRVLTLHTVFSPTVGHELSAGESILECEVPSVTLMPGQYNVSFFIDNGDIRLDAVPDAFTLHVVDGDYYGSGRTPFSGILVSPHNWRLSPAIGETKPEPEAALRGVAG